MPYIISDGKRLDIEDLSRTLARHIEKVGDLNFALTTIYDEILQAKGLRYSTIAMIIADAHGSITEFQRRIVGPYEDLKIKENGDAYITKVG